LKTAFQSREVNQGLGPVLITIIKTKRKTKSQLDDLGNYTGAIKYYDEVLAIDPKLKMH